MNLLPDTEKKILRKGLFSRFIIVSTFAVAGAIFVSLVGLIPAYVIARVKLVEVVSKSSIPIKSDEASATTSLATLPEEIRSKLQVYQSNVPKYRAADIFYEITKVKLDGVYIKSISLLSNSSSANTKTKNMNISGTAATRKALIDFAEILKKVELVSEVDVPVSSLAREKDLPFVVKITISEQ